MITYFLQDNKTNNKPIYKTQIDICKKENFLSFSFTAQGGGKFCPYSGIYNARHYEGDVCEVFIGNKNHYYEIEVTPDGSCLIMLINNAGNKVFSLDKYIENNFLKINVNRLDSGYFVEVLIPCDKLSIFDKQLYFNCFRIETDGGEKEKYLFSLNKTSNAIHFHESERFLMLPSEDELK